MNMSIKEIIHNAITEMEQAIKTIKKLKERLGQPIDGTRPLTETEQLCNDMEHSIERLNTIPITIIHAIMAGVYAGNAENSPYSIISEDFGYDSIAHCHEYLELAEQYDPIYDDDGKINTDCLHNDLSKLIYSIYTKGKNKDENLREIKTPVGTIYIENFFFREEEDRVKLYDSDKRYLDYFTTESIFETAKVKNCSHIGLIEEFIKNMEKKSTIAELLDYISLSWDEYSVDWEVIADSLVERTEHQINSVGELFENEWINKIGDYYILITEC